MLWMPSSPSTTLPPYFLMGFSACSAVGARSPGVDAVGARSDGVDGANACVACSSTYAAAIRMITQPGGSPVCRSVHAFDANAAVQELTQCPVICKPQTYLFNSSKHARQSRKRSICGLLGMPSVLQAARSEGFFVGQSRGVSGLLGEI